MNEKKTTAGAHEKIHEQIFTCDFCGKCLDSKQNLEVHINEFHDEFYPHLGIFSFQATMHCFVVHDSITPKTKHDSSNPKHGRRQLSLQNVTQQL